MEQRQYIPSMAGILLARIDSRIIGVFINDHPKYAGHTLEDAFIAASVNSLSAEIEKQGSFLMVKLARQPEEILQFASMWNMDGVVIIGFCNQDYTYLRQHMRIPFVVYDGFCETPPEGFVNITLDNFTGGLLVGGLFRRLGHPRALSLSDNCEGVDRLRFQGFREAMPGAELLRIPMDAEARWEFYQAHLPLFRQVSAVFAVSDYYAIDLILFLHRQGIGVPDTLSVAGFDDTPLSRLTWPPLTTVRQDIDARAALAVSSLQLLKSRQEPGKTVMLPVTLVERESVKRIFCK